MATAQGRLAKMEDLHKLCRGLNLRDKAGPKQSVPERHEGHKQPHLWLVIFTASLWQAYFAPKWKNLVFEIIHSIFSIKR